MAVLHLRNLLLGFGARLGTQYNQAGRQMVASYGLAQRARRLGAAELQTVATAMYERITTRHNQLLRMVAYEWCAEWAAWSA